MSVRLDKTMYRRESNGALHVAQRQLYVLQPNGSLSRVIDPNNVAATETLVQGFQDEALTISAGTGPFSANGDGQFDVWFPDGNYDLYAPLDKTRPITRWQTVAGTTNARLTSVEGVNATQDTAIAARPLKANLPINAADYGVLVGNTAAQNNTPLANWLAAVAGKEGYLPAGTYNYDAGLSGSAANTKIRTAGKGNTILNYTGTGVALTWGTGASTPNMNLVLEGIRIDGTASGAGGLHLNTFQDFTLINCDIKGFTNGYGINVNNSNSGVSFGTDVRQCSIGWRVGNNANLNHYFGGQVSGCTTGIHVVSNCYSNTWVGVNIVVNTRAVYLQYGQLSTFDRCFFEGNATGQTFSSSILVGDMADVGIAYFSRIINCYFTEVNILYGVRVWRGTETLLAGNVHAGSGANAFVRVDATNGIDTVLRDNVKGVAALLDDWGVRTRASGTGYGYPAIASAATITIPPGADVVSVTGTTTITSVTGSHIGRLITLVFAAALTVTDGGNLKLAGNFVTTADDTLTLRWDGTSWNEIGRSAN